MKLSNLMVLCVLLSGFAFNVYAGEANQSLQALQSLAGGLPPAAPPPQFSAPQSTQQVTPTQQEAPLNSGLKTGTKQEEDALEEAAFRASLQQAFPLNAEQILRLRQKMDETQYAESTSAKIPPKPIATSQFVKLEPGSVPPVIRLSQGFVSSVVFLDSTGAPWPIVAYDLGNPQAFNIQWDKSGNTLMIQSTKQYTYGNMAVRLKNLNTPVMLTLVPGQKVIDYRVDLRIQGAGPNAKPVQQGPGLPQGANNVLLRVLEGVTPPGGRVLRVLGGDAQAWLRGTKLYLRTRLTILSPGWLATMQSADGMRAYEMHRTPILLVSHHGKVMHLKLEGW